MGNMENPISAEALGERLRDLRKAARLTQPQLAQKIGKFLGTPPPPKANISKWEKGGVSKISMDYGLALSASLKADPFELLGFTRPPPSSEGKQQYHRQSISEAAALVGLEWDKLVELDAPYAAMFRETLELLVAQRKRDVAERGKAKRPRDDTRPPAET